MKKMKRFLVALLSCVTAIACVAGLSACNKEQSTSSSTPAVSSSSQETSSSDSSSSSEHVHSGGTATCTQKAVCAECEEEYGELAAHAWSEVAEQKATCTEDGKEAHFDCDNCDALAQGDEKTAVTEADLLIPAGHVWNEVPEVAATCTQDGKEAHFACECGALAQGEEKTAVTAEDLVVPMLDHVYGDWTITKDPTEEAQGTAERACECGEKETATLEVLTNVLYWTPVPGKEPTCTEAGYKKYSSVYGEVTVEYPVVPHGYVWTITVDPTEETVGSADGVCVCGATATEELPVLTDLRVWTPVPGKEPTCTEAGYKKYSSVYGEVTVDYPVVPHAWGEQIAQVNPTCQKDGNKAYYACANCDAVSLNGVDATEESIVLVKMDQHMCVEEGFVPEVPATCKASGTKAHYVCAFDDCDAIVIVVNDEKVNVENEEELVILYTEEEEVEYHKANGVYVHGQNSDCENDGWIEHYKCELCGDTFDENGVEVDPTIPALGHNLVNAYDVVKEYVTEMFYEEILSGGMILPEEVSVLELNAQVELMVKMLMKEVFPQGRTVNGMYCDFGLVCANCFDVEAWAMGEEEFGYAQTGLGHIGGEATCNEGAYCDRCGVEYTEPDETKHVEEVAATCCTLAVCELCGEEYGEYDLTVEGHDWVNATTEKNGKVADCFNDEIYVVVKCGDCDQLAVLKPVDGVDTYVLISEEEFAQGDVWTNLGSKLAHEGGFTAATCTEDATCSICGKSGNDLKLGEDDTTIYVAHHVWGEVIEEREAECGINGVSQAHRVCTVCGLIDVDEDGEPDDVDVVIPAEEHDFTSEGGNPASCTEDAKCSKCGKSGKDLVAEGEDFSEFVAHHTWREVDGKPATCGDKGYEKYWICTVCDEISNDGVNDGGAIVETDPLGHEFLQNNVVLGFDPDCENAGRHNCYTCTRYDDCGAYSLTAGSDKVATEEELVIPALGHVCTEETLTPAKAFDCTNDGNVAYWTCTRCEGFVVEKDGEKVVVEESALVIPADATAFHVEANLTAVLAKDYTCTEAGYSAHFVCPVCEAVFGKTDYAAAHRFTVEVEAVAPDCNSEGNIAYFKCELCDAVSLDGETVFEGETVIEATGEHTCADISKYCGNMVPCDGCGEIFNCPNPNPADHTWIEKDGKATCRYCHIVFDCNAYVGGDYIVTNVESLVKLAELVNGGNSFANVKVLMLCDVDLEGAAWTPIGTQAAPFSGKFDGKGHKVSNFVVNGDKGLGLFGYALKGNVSISNVTVENAEITGTDYLGGIVGYAYASVINCHAVNVTIIAEPKVVSEDPLGFDGGAKVGAIVGALYTDGNPTQFVVFGCTVNGANLKAYRDIAGIVGYSAANVEECSIANVNIVVDAMPQENYADGTPSGYYSDIIGRAVGGAVVKNCEGTAAIRTY